MALKRWVCGSDYHGDLACYETERAFLAFCDDFKPHKRIFGGDLLDLRALRRGASDFDRQHGASIDIDRSMRFLGAFRPNVFLYGNHDVRLAEFAEKGSTALEREWATMVQKDLDRALKGLRAAVLPYDARHGVYTLGRLRFVHGYFVGVSAARKHAATYGPVVFGHDHSISRAGFESIDDRRAWGGGCLCKLDLGYDDRSPAKLRHANGWTYGWYDDKTGDYAVHQAQQICGRWVLPEGFKTYK